MSKKDWTLTFLFVLAWGTNYSVSKLGIGMIPPMLLASLRFLMVAVPACFFVRPPRIALRYVVGYAVMVIGTFACSFYAIYIGMPAGLASVVSQSSAFITILLATLFFRERLQAHHLIGLLIATAGLFLIGISSAPTAGVSIPAMALILTIGSAAFWSLAAIVIKKAALVAAKSGGQINMASLVVWAAFIPPIPLLLLALIMDPPQVVWEALRGINWSLVLVILFLAWGSTLFGTSVWNYLIAKYETGRVAPLALLVPVVGLLVARIALNEQLSGMQWAGSIVIIIGLMIFNLGFQPLRRLLVPSRRDE